MQNFCDIYWPCSYTTKKGQRCVNVRTGHSKGHQTAKGKIRAGDYQSSFSAKVYGKQWLATLKQNLDDVQKEFQDQDSRNGRTTSSNQTALEVHRNHMSKFFMRVGGATKYVSHTTCFCCLKEVPQHLVFCGHVLCTACIEAYGTTSSQSGASRISLSACPLHPMDLFVDQWHVSFKPLYAGVRVLSLDG